MDRDRDRILEALSDKPRDTVTGDARHLRREKSDGRTSHLRLGKEETVYRYDEFWIIRSEYVDEDEGLNTTIIYN